jgi:hypothetical protein
VVQVGVADNVAAGDSVEAKITRGTARAFSCAKVERIELGGGNSPAGLRT